MTLSVQELAIVQQMVDALEEMADCGADVWGEHRPCNKQARAALAAGRALLQQPKQPEGHQTARDDEAPTVSGGFTACFDKGCNDCVDYDGYDEVRCPECEGDGGDKWNDYCMPCATCDGSGRLW